MYRNWINARLLMSPDGDGSGGDNSGGNNSNENLPDAVAKAFEKLLERKGGDASAVAMMLFNENKAYRDTINELRGKVPAEGAVILGGDEAKDWQEYRTLGSAADVKQGLEQRAQLQAQVEASQRESTLRTVAETAGYKPTVLMQLDQMAKAQGKALAFEVREVQQEGKTARVPFVKDGESEQSLSDYATAQWGDFLPALTANSQGQGGGSNGAGTQGVRFPAQGTGGNNPPPNTKDVATATLNKAYASRKDK